MEGGIIRIVIGEKNNLVIYYTDNYGTEFFLKSIFNYH
jgi:hypothetical protein